MGLSIQAQISTPPASPKSKIEQVVGLTTINIEYSRPSMKGRTIFASNGLVPFDKMWRTGANQATKVSFSTDATVGGYDLKAGSYAVLSKPSASNWEFYFYNYDKSSWSSYLEAEPAATITVSPMASAQPVETFSIYISDLTSKSATLNIAWDKTVLPLKMMMDPDKAVMENIDAVLAGPTKGDYYSAATYYHTAGKSLPKALAWIEKATAGDNPRFWQVRRKALILADMGQMKKAVDAATESLNLAQEAGNEDYVRMNQKDIKAWGLKMKAKN